MTTKEKELAAKMLEEAADKMGNAGCNDVEESFWEGWTKEERQTFVKEYHEWNGDLCEYDPEFLELPDYAIADFLAYKLNPEK